MKEIFVGVTGINAVDNPGPGVGVARSLKDDKDLNVRVVGLAYDAMEPGIYLDWLIDKAYIMPYPSGGHKPYIQRLKYVKESYGLDFVIPSLDAELPMFIKYSKEIEDAGIKLFLPTMEQFKMRGKDRLADVAEKIGIRIPKTEIATSYNDLMAAVYRIGLPVMIKGAFYKAYRAYTAQEATGYYNCIVAEWGYPIIVQEVVSGEEMNVVAVGDGEGGGLGMMGIKKLRVTSLGKIWTGVAIKNEKMQDAAEKFISEYKWKGAFELECIVSDEDVYMIEINPRLPAWSYFSTGVGINLPSNMVRKAYGLPLPKDGGYPAGKLYIRYTYELVTDMRPFQDMMTQGENANENSV
jgi:carbamoyl-phosphate synthase large subunit